MAVILVGHDAGEGRDLPACQIIPDVLSQSLQTLGIVASVHNEVRIPAQQLKPAGPGHVPEALADVFLTDAPALLLQAVHHRQHHGGVFQLMLPQQGQEQLLPAAAVETLPLEAVAMGHQGIKVPEVELCPHLQAFPGIHSLHLGLVPVGRHMAARLNDTGLGFGNLLDGVAQDLRMLQTQVTDHRHLRGVDDIGRVQLAAQAHLQRHNVTLVPGKIFHGDDRYQLKLRGMVLHGLGVGLHIFRNVGQLLVGDVLPVHIHPLIEAEDVGRGVKAGAVARLTEDGRGHGGGGALAVGARDVDKFQLLLRIPQPAKQLLGPGQARDGALPAYGMDVSQCFFVSHDAVSKR